MRCKVISYAVGSKDVGTGHLTRQRDFLNVFSEAAEPLLITHRLGGASHLFRNKHFKIHWFARSGRALHRVLEMVKSERPSCMIVDHLEADLDVSWMRQLRLNSGLLVAFTDDSKVRDLTCDVLVNGNPCQKKSWYPKSGPLRLLGPEYFVLSPDIESLRSKIRPLESTAKRILVSFGGSDHHNLLLRALEPFSRLPKYFHFTLVTGPSSGLQRRVVQQSRVLGLENVKIQPYFQDFSQQLLSCDMALTAGGNTLFQRIALGTPGMTLCQLERQNEIAAAFQKKGCNYNLGMWNKFSFSRLDRAILDFSKNKNDRVQQRKKGMRLIDGKAASRIIKAVRARLKETCYEK